jgi:hypothetical protein
MYFLALVFVPCGDKDDCNEMNHTEIARANDHEEHSGEVCTPLCSCACCASHFLNDEFQPTREIVAVIHTVHTLHRESKITSAIISIWQPPKLA